MFDSIQIRFPGLKEWPSPFAHSRQVPFVQSYFNVIKSCIGDIQTEYFWVFPSFMSLWEGIDFTFIPEQHEKDQIHVWYSTHRKAGMNKEGNVFLIPTKKFKEQIQGLKFLRDYKDINYHPVEDLWYPTFTRYHSILGDMVNTYNNTDLALYKWISNNQYNTVPKPNFFPSFWEDVKCYTFGKHNDFILAPGGKSIKQFYDFDRMVNAPYDYDVKPMDIIFVSYDEPDAEQKYNELKTKYPRAKWSKGVKGRTQAYQAAANMSDTEFFFTVWPKLDLVDSFDFTFQPDRLKNRCHYIFHAKNPVNGLEYGHGAVLLYNKKLVLEHNKPGIDFTLSQSHDTVPIMSAINNFNKTPLMAWRTTFREVLKLNMLKQTVETKFRIKKWCELGVGENADWVHKGSQDAMQYFKDNQHNPKELFKSYELEWLNDYFESKYSVEKIS